ncbi:hypothetical protein H4582DRAFT_2061163 [Lactarius indigo]|nr:hypothetical protein H4582DRAFT_2061163 [Lactarius indigo]
MEVMADHYVAHTLATEEVGSLHVRHMAFEVLPELNHALKWWAVGHERPAQDSDVPLEAEVQVGSGCRVQGMMRPHPLLFLYLLTWTRAMHNAASETPTTMPVSIMHNLPALCLEHGHLLQKQGADSRALRQCGVEVQASYTSEEAAQVTGHVEQAKGQHIRELEALVGKCKASRSTRVAPRREEEEEKDREELEQLEQTLFDLCGEIGAGRHMPSGCAQPAQIQVCAAPPVPPLLKNALTALTQTQMARSSWCRMRDRQWSAKKAELELKQCNKHMLHLQQVFASRTTEFHEALSAILGAKLMFYDNGQNWVEIKQSIPYFLASVAFKCYNKWKGKQQ